MDGLDEQAWSDVERSLCADLWSYTAGTPEASEVLIQFISDGGKPWDIYEIEVAFLGKTLEQMAQTSDWQTY